MLRKTSTIPSCVIPIRAHSGASHCPFQTPVFIYYRHFRHVFPANYQPPYREPIDPLSQRLFYIITCNVLLMCNLASALSLRPRQRPRLRLAYSTHQRWDQSSTNVFSPVYHQTCACMTWARIALPCLREAKLCLFVGRRTSVLALAGPCLTARFSWRQVFVAGFLRPTAPRPYRNLVFAVAMDESHPTIILASASAHEVPLRLASSERLNLQ